MAHSSNPSPWKAEARGLQIRGQPGLQSQTLCLKKKKMTTWSQSAVFSFWTHSHQLLILLSKLHNHNPELYLKCFALQFPLVYFIRTNWTLGAGCFHMLWRMGEHRAADRAEHTHWSHRLCCIQQGYSWQSLPLCPCWASEDVFCMRALGILLAVRILGWRTAIN